MIKGIFTPKTDTEHKYSKKMIFYLILKWNVYQAYLPFVLEGCSIVNELFVYIRCYFP